MGRERASKFKRKRKQKICEGQTDLEGDVVVAEIRQLHGARDLLLQLDCSGETSRRSRAYRSTPAETRKKREGFSPKEQRNEKTGGHRRSTYMGSGAREGRCVAARRWWQERGRPLPDQRGRGRTGAIRQRGGDLGAGG